MEVNAVISLKAITVGNYSKRDGGASFFLYGLGIDNNVYRWDDRVDGWVPMPMYIRKAVQRMIAQEEVDDDTN